MTLYSRYSCFLSVDTPKTDNSYQESNKDFNNQDLSFVYLNEDSIQGMFSVRDVVLYIFNI